MLRKILSFFFTLSILSLNAAPLFAAECEKTQAIEHLDVHKKAPCNVVTITNLRNIVEKGNVLQFVLMKNIILSVLKLVNSLISLFLKLFTLLKEL